jgi:hypothetical protein
MKIDPVALTNRLTEANVHPGFYKMLGLKGPAYKWVKCPLSKVKVGDTIKIVEYDELPKYTNGVPRISEGWLPRMQDQCGKEFKVATEQEARRSKTDVAYVARGSLHVGCGTPYHHICWHGYKLDSHTYKDNLFYVRRACES